jgi:amidase
VLQAAVATLVAAGARFIPAVLVDGSGVMDRFTALVAAGVRHDMMAYIATHHPPVTSVEDLIAYNAAESQRRIPFGQPVLENMAGISADIDADTYTDMALQMTQAAESTLEAAFAATAAEVLLSFENMHSPFYATAGYPAITVPMGLRQNGGIAAALGLADQHMPVGITLIGKRGGDGKLLAYAFAFEQASHLRVDPVLE